MSPIGLTLKTSGFDTEEGPPSPSYSTDEEDGLEGLQKRRRGSVDGTMDLDLGTNCLILTDLPNSVLSSTSLLNDLKQRFAELGQLGLWAVLTSFKRIMVVYRQEEAAQRAKMTLDHTQFHGKGIRVYWGTRQPLGDGNDGMMAGYRNLLKVPELEKNWLISPPGSPPVGWEPRREDPPNTDTIAADLVKALEALDMKSLAEGLDDDDVQTSENVEEDEGPTNSTSIVLADAEDDTPKIMVQDWDAESQGMESRSSSGLQPKKVLPPRFKTARPPMDE